MERDGLLQCVKEIMLPARVEHYSEGRYMNNATEKKRVEEFLMQANPEEVAELIVQMKETNPTLVEQIIEVLKTRMEKK